MSKILITGTSTGFGRRLVEHLVNSGHGHHIAATMRGINGRNAQAAEELSKLENVKVYELDVTDDASVKGAIQSASNDFGGLDVLVNNAGVYGGGLIEAYSIDQFHRMFDINVYGTLRTIKAVLPGMRAQKSGLIVNLSSMLGMFPFPGNIPYDASKFAVEGITLGMAMELKPFGIESVIVQPGAYPTEIFAKSGVNADEEDTLASYNGYWEQMSAGFQQNFGAMMEKHQPNPQAVVEKIHALIDMPAGSRPLRNPVDDISGDVAQKAADQVTEAAYPWYKSYGM